MPRSEAALHRVRVAHHASPPRQQPSKQRDGPAVKQQQKVAVGGDECWSGPRGGGPEPRTQPPRRAQLPAPPTPIAEQGRWRWRRGPAVTAVAGPESQHDLLPVQANDLPVVVQWRRQQAAAGSAGVEPASRPAVVDRASVGTAAPGSWLAAATRDLRTAAGAAITGHSKSMPATMAAAAEAAPSVRAPLSPMYMLARRRAPRFAGDHSEGRFHTRSPAPMAAMPSGQPTCPTPAASPAASAAPAAAIATVPGVRPSMPSLKLVASVLPRMSARYHTLSGTCAPVPEPVRHRVGRCRAGFAWAPGPTTNAVAPTLSTSAMSQVGALGHAATGARLAQVVRQSEEKEPGRAGQHPPGARRRLGRPTTAPRRRLAATAAAMPPTSGSLPDTPSGVAIWCAPAFDLGRPKLRQSAPNCTAEPPAAMTKAQPAARPIANPGSMRPSEVWRASGLR